MNRKQFDEQICQVYGESLDSFSDLLGDGYNSMSTLFYLLNKRYLHWLDNNPEIAISKEEIRFRKKFYKVLQKIGPGVLKCSQILENRKRLNNPSCCDPDAPVDLPDTPLIFASNHGFHDDVLATVLAAGRPVYLIWGSLPLLFNTVDGFATALVGCVCLNRKKALSRKALIRKAVKAMEHGMSIVFFPEGGWNKTSEKLTLPLWKGVYDLSAAAKCPVVPITHYVRNPEILKKNNVIHTVIDDPICLYDYERDTGLTLLRDVFSSWTYKMMELYGKSTRDAEMTGFAFSNEKWNAHLHNRMKSVARYDSTIEKQADYRPKKYVTPEDAFAPIAQINDENITAQNIQMVLGARKIVEEWHNGDFQRLF